jgi:hypothetical protein
LPITISLSQDYGLSPGWYFSVNSAGEGQMTIPDEPDVVQSVKVSKPQLKQLRDLLVREQFFTLEDQYGELVPDGGMQTLTINVGEWTKTVRLHYLGNWIGDGDTAKLRDPARAVRVWMLIRRWFNLPDAIDSRVYDQRVLNAVDAEKTGN